MKKISFIIALFAILITLNITNVNATVVIKHDARGESTGGEIAGPDMEAHLNGVFCRDYHGTITFAHYKDSKLNSSGKDKDGTVETSQGTYNAFTSHRSKIFKQEYAGERCQNRLHNASQQTYSISTYKLEEDNPDAGLTPTRELTLAEQYIFAHSNDEFVQSMYWKYLETESSVVPNGGTAKDIVEEALTYEYVVNAAIDPVLNSDNVTVMYSFTTKQFLIGPLSLDYLKYSIYGCSESEVAQAENNGGKIDFCGLEGASIELDGKTVALSADDFVYPEGRSTESLTDPNYQYPFPGETFYIRLNMSDVADTKALTNITFNFQKYTSGSGSLHNLTGYYEVTQWTPKSKSHKETCTEGYDNTWYCDNGEPGDPCIHDWEKGHYVGDKQACPHGYYEEHEYIASWEEWLEATNNYCINSQQLVSVYTDVTVEKDTVPAEVDLGNPGGSEENPGGSEENPGGPGENPGGSGENPGGPGENPGGPGENPGGPGGNPGENPGGSGGINPGGDELQHGVSLRMDYGGYVWEDSFTGKLQEQDGLFAGAEKGMENVKVTIYNIEDNMPYASTYTDKDGKYLFEQIRMGQYYAVFEYDGQTYQPTTYFAGGEESFATNSKAQEKKEDRINFNNQFREITESGGVGPGGAITPIDSDTRMSAITMDDSNNIVYYPRENEVHIEDWDKYITDTLYTAIYPKILQINLGLTKRTEADFDVKKDVYKVIVQINGKTVEYTYNSRQNITNSFDVEVKRDPSYANQTYDRVIYKSDYNYRKSEYDTGSDGATIASAKEDSELKVFVIYRLTFRNASEIYSGTINELVDYYDEEYSYTGESWYGTPTTTGNVVEWTSAPKYGAAKKYPGLNTLYTTTTSNIMLSSGDQEEIYMKFEVNKHTDESGKENSIWLDENSETGQALGGKNNIMEITSYSTYKEGTTIGQKNNPENIEGKIDKDSTPNNANPNDLGSIEDDTDGAPRLNLILNKGEERNIGGIIWEDARNNTLANGQLTGNGTREEGETKVNGAVVQLVEKIEVGGETYEHIWQEMESGNLAGRDGEYFFEGYIPGNYIIRVIYGDNANTVQTRENGGKNDISYNGQDYKSTIYKAVETDGYYDKDANAANPNTSKAKDNALRRLEVIDYSRTMSNHIGNVLSAPYESPSDAGLIQELIANTWMYADTAVIVSDVEYNTQAIENLADSQNTTPTYKIENVGMGIEERPRTNLELTKQIDNVVATLGGGTVMLDAKNGIKENLQMIPNAYDGTDENKKQLTRNYWQFATDSELLQGMQVKIYYKITITNNGQIDTVGRTYDSNRRSGITLSEAEEMLGSAYYYGTLDNVQNVTTKVDKIIDYVDKYIGFDPEAETNKENNWGEVSIDDLKAQQILSETINITTNTTNNKSIMTDKLTSEELDPGDENNNQTSTELVLSRLLGRDGGTFEYSYNNIAEIIEFTNTVGRRDQGSTPGNADPHIINKTNIDDPSKEEEHAHGEKFELENDTDISENFNILPPTGENKGTMYYYIIAAISGLTALALGIVLIKKYVL